MPRLNALVAISMTIAAGINLSFGKAPSFAQQNISGTVISIGDGDTIRVKQNNRTVTVRLACIDAPEIAQKPWGERSKYRLWQFLQPGQIVKLREVEKDRYGRTVAEVFKDNRSINLQMVKEGYAVIYQQYLGGCNTSRSQYLQAESGAKNNRLAFWSQPSPIMPWDFRRQPNRIAQPSSTPKPEPIASPTSIPVASPATRATSPSPTPIPVASPATRTTPPVTPEVGTPLREPTEGQGCRCPYDYDKRGNLCGGRSAYSRPGGDSPRCYVGD